METEKLSYDERLRRYEAQKKVASLVSLTSEEYESMVKYLAKLWRI